MMLPSIMLSIDESVSSNIPEGVSSNIPKGASSNIPKGASSNIPKGASSNIPEGVQLDIAARIIVESIASGLTKTGSMGIGELLLGFCEKYEGFGLYLQGIFKDLIIALAKGKNHTKLTLERITELPEILNVPNIEKDFAARLILKCLVSGHTKARLIGLGELLRRLCSKHKGFDSFMRENLENLIVTLVDEDEYQTTRTLEIISELPQVIFGASEPLETTNTKIKEDFAARTIVKSLWSRNLKAPVKDIIDLLKEFCGRYTGFLSFLKKDLLRTITALIRLAHGLDDLLEISELPKTFLDMSEPSEITDTEIEEDFAVRIIAEQLCDLKVPVNDVIASLKEFCVRYTGFRSFLKKNFQRLVKDLILLSNGSIHNLREISELPQTLCMCKPSETIATSEVTPEITCYEDEEFPPQDDSLDVAFEPTELVEEDNLLEPGSSSSSAYASVASESFESSEEEYSRDPKFVDNEAFARAYQAMIGNK